MAALDAETASVRVEEIRTVSEMAAGFSYFQNGDVLVAKITPCFQNGKIAQANISTRHAFGSTEFHVLRPIQDHLDGRFLLHFLRQKWVLLEGERKMTGSAGQRRVPKHFLKSLEIPAFPLPEQRRLAAILDQAEILRAKRRAALVKLDTLAQSIFIEMFGDPVTNPNAWPSVPLREIIRFPLRNGLSPSDAGTVEGRVLTLSAITRGAFDPTAWKEAKFHVAPPQDQVVDVEDLLVCRGNGNPDLVGRGHFPTESMTNVLFPDTMIAARLDTDRLPKRFVEFVWNGPGVRQQIGKLVRTTNGTYKVNQGMLEGVMLPTPPHNLQLQFANYLESAATHRELFRTSMTYLDALFSSLQHRAFRGEL